MRRGCFRGASWPHDVAPDLRARDPLAAEGHLREGRASATLAETREADQTLIRMLDRMLAGRTGLSPVMVGRTSPLSRLTGLMASSDGEPAVALVVGEAGVGKTRLLRELVSSVPARRAGARRPGRARVARPSVRARARRPRPRRRAGGDRPPRRRRAGVPRSRRQRSRPHHLRGPALGRCREPRSVRAPRDGHSARERCSSVRTARKS